jgi:hypothetical protein
MASLAAQARVGIAKDESRYQGGVVGKLWVEQAKLLFLGEADVIRQQVSAASFGQTQVVSYSGLSWFPVRGLMVSGAFERFQESLAVSTTGRNAYDLQVNVFPYAHCEVLLLGRLVQVSPQVGETTVTSNLLMLQLHYYL